MLENLSHRRRLRAPLVGSAAKGGIAAMESIHVNIKPRTVLDFELEELNLKMSQRAAKYYCEGFSLRDGAARSL